MSNALLSGSIIASEFSYVIANALDLEKPPHVSVVVDHDICADAYRYLVKCGDATVMREIPSVELGRSLDDFSARWVIPMVSEMYGRPLLDDAGRIVVNPVHDLREAA